MTPTATETDTPTAAAEETLLACRRCQRRSGLSGGICAFCMAESAGWVEEDAAKVDRALATLREQAVREGWVGKDPDIRPLPAGKRKRSAAG
jgi:hypothetical protein